MEDPIAKVRRELREREERLIAAQNGAQPPVCQHGDHPMRCHACRILVPTRK